MALAIIQFEANNGKTTRFHIDIGTVNRFYAYSIGDDRTFTRNGLTFLENSRFVSPVLGPLAPETLGRTFLEIPSDRFDFRYRYLQLFSFRDRHRNGPALSPIIPVPVTSNPMSLSFSSPSVMETSTVSTRPFSYQPSDMSMTLGLFSSIGKIVGKVASGVVKAVKAVAPVAAPILTGILGPEAGVAVTGVTKLLDTLLPGTKGKPQKIKAQLQNPDTLNQIVSLISQLQNAKAAPSTAKAMSFDGYSPFPGRAMMPPEVFDRMPSLMPLLGRSLHPETVRTISSGPMRSRVLMGTIAHGALEAGKHFPGFIRAIADELREEDPDLVPLRNGLNGREPEYHRQETVRLHFADIRPHQRTGGGSRVLYRLDEDITFPLVLETPRPITRGTVRLLVKNPETLEVLAEEKYRVENLRSGPVHGVFRLGRAQLRSLKPNEEYLICAVLTWTARSSHTGNKRRLGTSTAVLVSLVGDYIFDRLEGVEETIALNDPKEYRPYWHKVWQGNFAEDGQHITLDCKYYYVLEPKERNNARMETMLHMDDRDTSDRSGKLKTGMVLSPRQLEQLLAWISDRPRLDDQEIAALSCCEFRDSFHQLARTQVEFEGDEGDSATLWVYPEVDLRRVVLKQVMDSDANGRVLELSDRVVYFPFPSVARFVGTRS